MTGKPAVEVASLDHLVLTVRDIDRTCAFYEQALGMQRRIFGPDKRTALHFGTQKLNLHPTSQVLDPNGRVLLSYGRRVARSPTLPLGLLKRVSGGTQRSVGAQQDQDQSQGAGGNDALGSISLLSDPTLYTFSEVLDRLHRMRESFRSSYAATLDHILARQRPTVVCTIYNPQFDEALLQRTGEAALSIFNDVIMQEAVRRRVPLIDLRLVCSEPAHFANPIEPSNEGGARIAEAIVSAVSRLAPRP